MASKKISTRELGLLLISRVLKGGDLHYGYWPDGMETTWVNLKAAQTAYSDLLIEHIPGDAETILDVGMGTGGLSEKLVARGYEVEGVLPSSPLAELATDRLGESFKIHPCRFEEMQTETRYDLIVFSESFQYIKPELSLPMAHSLLNPGGHVLIIDFFRTDSEEKGPVGGGHNLTEFYRKMKEQPFTILEDIDITRETAPTIDLMGQLLKDYVRPIYSDMTEYFLLKHPWWSRFTGWMLGGRIKRIRKEVYSDRFNGECFCRSHSYRIMLLGGS